MRPFFSVPPPAHRPDEVALTADVSDPVDRQGRIGLVARLYTWGPKVDDWPHAAHWQARWLWPFGGSQDVHSTLVGPAPYANADAARHALGGQQGTLAMAWTLATGDDPTHALAVARRGSETTVLELEADRPLVELRRADGELFPELDAAERVAGRWYLATPQGGGELPAEVLWQVDGSVARELTHVARAAVDGRPMGTHLARRSDGRAVGLVVDGQPSVERSVPIRWVLPVDIDSGVHGEPQPLGLNDLSDRGDLGLCGGDEGGWVLDGPLASNPHIRVGDREILLTNPYARLRLSRTSGCIERMSGSLEMMSAPVDVLWRKSSTGAHRAQGQAILVAANASSRRIVLRCTRTER
jgi:hypothetical protein